jgi:hypothetical protein
MNNAVFWDVMPCASCKNRRFGGTYRTHHQSGKNQRPRNKLLVTANVPSSLVLVTLMTKAIRSCGKSVLTTATRRHILQNKLIRFLTWDPLSIALLSREQRNNIKLSPCR